MVPFIGENSVTVGKMRRASRSESTSLSVMPISDRICVRSSSRDLACTASVCATRRSRSGSALPSNSNWLRRRRSLESASSAIAARNCRCASTMAGERSLAIGWPDFTGSSAATSISSTSPPAGAAMTRICCCGMATVPGSSKSVPPRSRSISTVAMPAARMPRSSIGREMSDAAARSVGAGVCAIAACDAMAAANAMQMRTPVRAAFCRSDLSCMSLSIAPDPTGQRCKPTLLCGQMSCGFRVDAARWENRSGTTKYAFDDNCLFGGWPFAGSRR